MKKLGFGTTRLPVLSQEDPAAIDLKRVCQMMDTLMERGFIYFNMAHAYHKYESEGVVKRALTKCWPRERYVLAGKLSLSHPKKKADMGCFFREQLEKCGIAYFDYYMLRSMSRSYYETAGRLGVFEFVRRKEERGKARKIGFSFHTDTELLEGILEKHPEVDFVQLQLNYTDWDNSNIQSRQCYEVCHRYGKNIIVMGPVRGGTLAHVPWEARDLMEAHAPDMAPAPWAVRFVASREGVIMVLSGVSGYIQLLDNIAYMRGFVPLTKEGGGIMGRTAEIIQSAAAILYTSCQYCVEGCPKQIPTPKCFSLHNQYSLFGEKPNSRGYYQNYAGRYGKAGDCTGCRRYEAICLQHLPVIQRMREITEVFGLVKQGAGIGKNGGNQRKWCKIPRDLNTPMLYHGTVTVDVYNKEE